MPGREVVDVAAGHHPLDEVLQWFLANPPDGTNRSARRRKMAEIQAVCDQVAPSTYQDYVEHWKNDDSQASILEDQNPALYYLRAAIESAVSDIQKSRIQRGTAIWHLYNMGYVFRTPESCFGIDVKVHDSQRLATQLAGVLDFLLITHEHHDHWSPALIDAMIKAGKPVITRWRDGTRIVTKATEFRFGDCRVKVDIGDHHNPRSQDDMLMFQVDCGESADRCTVYHSGGGNNFGKMIPDQEVDVFIPHVQVGMSVEAAIGHLKPRRTLVSHVLELGHSPKPPHAWRWSFDYAFGRVRSFPESKAMVLTWGERWPMPGTILRREPQR